MKRTIEVVDTWLKQSHKQTIQKLEIDPKNQLKYLLCLLEEKEDYIDEVFKEDALNVEMKNEAKDYKELVMFALKLLCENNKDRVIKFVKKKFCPLQECLEMCKSYKVDLAVAYLLRRSGDYADALEIYIKTLKETTEKMLADNITKESIERYIAEYKSIYKIAMKICRKNALITIQDKKLWFKLLSQLYDSWQRITQETEASSSLKIRKLFEMSADVLNACIKELLDKMLEYIPFDLVISEVMDNNAKLELENFKELFNTMLISYLFQDKLLNTAGKIIGNYLLKLTSGLINYRTKALSITNGCCGKCGSYVKPEHQRNFYIFRCGHIIHRFCINSYKKCEICSKSTDSNLLYLIC